MGGEPQVDASGGCALHPGIQLRHQKKNGEWRVLLNACPLCVSGLPATGTSVAGAKEGEGQGAGQGEIFVHVTGGVAMGAYHVHFGCTDLNVVVCVFIGFQKYLKNDKGKRCHIFVMKKAISDESISEHFIVA